MLKCCSVPVSPITRIRRHNCPAHDLRILRAPTSILRTDCTDIRCWLFRRYEEFMGKAYRCVATRLRFFDLISDKIKIVTFQSPASPQQVSLVISHSRKTGPASAPWLAKKPFPRSTPGFASRQTKILRRSHALILYMIFWKYAL